MTIESARRIIADQHARIRTRNKKRFEHDGYEYEIRYEGGFTEFVSLWRRQIGKRYFTYYKGCGCWDCHGAASAMEKIQGMLP